MHITKYNLVEIENASLLILVLYNILVDQMYFDKPAIITNSLDNLKIEKSN
jgi:hypothetical protein